MAIGKYFSPKNDVAFKRLFGTDKNKDILLAMLNAVLKNQLHTPITDVRFLSPYQEPEAWSKKESIVDVLCKNQEGCQYIIQLNVATYQEVNFEENTQYYAAKAFISQCKKGGEYEGLKEVIFVSFCDFPVFPEKEHYKVERVTPDKKSKEPDLDKFSFTFIDLIKFDEQRRKSLDQLTLEEKFYYFLKHARDITPQKLSKLIEEEKIIEKAFHELDHFFWSDQEIRRYEAAEKRLRDNRAVLAHAFEEGFKKIQEGAAKQMMTTGMDIKFISEVTGLSLEEIEDLKKKQLP